MGLIIPLGPSKNKEVSSAIDTLSVKHHVYDSNAVDPISELEKIGDNSIKLAEGNIEKLRNDKTIDENKRNDKIEKEGKKILHAEERFRQSSQKIEKERELLGKVEKVKYPKILIDTFCDNGNGKSNIPDKLREILQSKECSSFLEKSIFNDEIDKVIVQFIGHIYIPQNSNNIGKDYKNVSFGITSK